MDSGVLFALFTCMGGFMTYNYLRDNLDRVSPARAVDIGLVIVAMGIWIAFRIPEDCR